MFGEAGTAPLEAHRAEDRLRHTCKCHVHVVASAVSYVHGLMNMPDLNRRPKVEVNG